MGEVGEMCSSVFQWSSLVLGELYGGSPGEGPRRPLFDIGRDVRLFLVAQEVEGETHRREVDFLEQAGNHRGAQRLTEVQF